MFIFIVVLKRPRASNFPVIKIGHIRQKCTSNHIAVIKIKNYIEQKCTTVRLPLLHGHPCPSDLVSIEICTPAEPCARITLHPLKVALHSAPRHGGAQEFPLPGLFLGEVTRGLGLEAAAPLLFTDAWVSIRVTWVEERPHTGFLLVVLHYCHLMFVQVVVLVLVQLMELPHHRLDTVTLSIYKFKKNTCYQNLFFSMRRKQNITNQNVSLILIKTDNFIDSGMLIILTTSVQRFCNFTFITNVKGFKIYVCLIQRFWHLSIQSFPPPNSPQQGTLTPHFIEVSTHLSEARSHFSLWRGCGPSPHGASHEVSQTSPGDEQPSFLGPSCHKLNTLTTFVIHVQ